MSELKDIDANELGLISAVLGIVLAYDKTPDEQNVLGNFIVGIGCIILVIAAQAEYLNSLQEKKSENGDSLEIKKQIQEMQKQIDVIMSETP
ncbi:hypothetical protein SOV_30940 [Sporomusa ovata DSM 2662]|uniref:Uncharacterized protein n=1 Tax=Sporomusa ovata TaxID=2378 RepID=A0A0U1L1N7_9FIRM|nr:hypothetical protein [Sporomusa ovata]EQB25049.1 hypothetical protein SOV_5c01980 [Sporomusa ovata DSM 2662]CQR73598.1 hypothetical protein SpAn4DRAFT_0060 [Sporomusa ovata]